MLIRTVLVFERKHTLYTCSCTCIIFTLRTTIKSNKYDLIHYNFIVVSGSLQYHVVVIEKFDATNRWQIFFILKCLWKSNRNKYILNHYNVVLDVGHRCYNRIVFENFLKFLEHLLMLDAQFILRICWKNGKTYNIIPAKEER